MKKLAAVAMVSAVVMAGCGQSSDQKDKASDKEKVLTVGTEGTYAPFSFHDKKGKLTGYDVEVARSVADKMGYKVKFVETQWDSMFSGLNAGRFTTVANQVGINKERQEKYQFSTPYTYSNAVLITKKNNDSIQSFADVKGKKLAQTLTSNYGKLAKDNGADIVQVEGFNQSVELIQSGRAEAAFNDKISVLDYMKQKKNANLKMIDGDAEQSKSGFVFTKKTDKALVKKVNQALKEMQDSGELTKISKKWFDEDVSKS